MSNLVVLTFGDTEQAGQVFDALREVQRGGHLKLVDAAVVVKQESGKVEITNQLDAGVKWGAFGGGVLGLLLAGIFFPVAGIAVGVIGGALVGKAMDLGISRHFVENVTETLKPGTSALFVIGKSDSADEVMEALRPFKGTIYQTTLPTEAVAALQDALKNRE